MTRQNMLLAAGVIALAVVPLLTIVPGPNRAEVFGGSDDHASQLITTIRPDYHRWITPLWEPPSSEIESLLFAVQAAIGTGAVAYCLGYWRGRRRERADHAARD